MILICDGSFEILVFGGWVHVKFLALKAADVFWECDFDARWMWTVEWPQAVAKRIWQWLFLLGNFY